MEKKYELLKDDSVRIGDYILYRIKALKDFDTIKKGDLGGYIEKESNLSHDGNCWVSGSARVFGNAEVSGSAWVHGNAIVSDNARVSNDAEVSSNARVFCNAEVSGNKTFILPLVFIFSNTAVSELYKSIN